MIHPSADVSPRAVIGEGTRIWHQAQVREGAHIGQNCIIGKNAYVDFDVTIGENVKIQNNSSLYHGVTVEDGVFIGPHVCLTNDKYPRAINPDGTLKGGSDWEVGRIVVQHGCALGAGLIIVTGVTIGRWALVGAGAVVTRDVPDHGLVAGNPARLIGYVCTCGHRLAAVGDEEPEGVRTMRCPSCRTEYRLEDRP